MRVILIGHGKTGSLIQEHAASLGVEIVHTITSKTKLTKEHFSNIDVMIDFSSPQGIVERVEMAASQKVAIVMGTTGWEQEKAAVLAAITKHQGALISSPNFSIGVQLFYLLAKRAGELFSNEKSYDVSALELHHRQKKDAPSGTAKEISSILLKELHTKTKESFELPEGAVEKDTLYTSCVRVGNIPGTHTVLIDSPEDTIELTHTARNRNGFAIGALKVALWIKGKQGIFTMENFLCDR